MDDPVKRLAESYMGWNAKVTEKNFAELEKYRKIAGRNCTTRFKLGIRKDGTLTLIVGCFDASGKQVGEWLDESWLCPPFCLT